MRFVKRESREKGGVVKVRRRAGEKGIYWESLKSDPCPSSSSQISTKAGGPMRRTDRLTGNKGRRRGKTERRGGMSRRSVSAVAFVLCAYRGDLS